MRVKLFSMAATTPIQSLENDINEFLESQRPHVTYVSVSSSDIERVASVWYEEPHHRTSNRLWRNWRSWLKSPEPRATWLERGPGNHAPFDRRESGEADQKPI